jgi:histidine triad (HIT) family protein
MASASPDTVFGKILRGEIPAKTLHSDDRCIAIADVSPQAPFHALVIPRRPIASLADASAEDEATLGHLLLVAREVATKAGCGAAFRVVANSGAGAGQSVMHLHLHVLGGRAMKWPPG